MKNILAIFSFSLFASNAFAVPITFFDIVDAGAVTFDEVVATVEGTVNIDTLTGISRSSEWDRGAYSIASSDGRKRSVYSASVDASTGPMISINPNGQRSGGITFDFLSPVNAIGFEVGDWATCCFTSSLFIEFDGGVTQTVATASSPKDNPNDEVYKQSVFVGAIDDSDTFTKVSFYGDGVGEFMTAGGTVRYGVVGLDSVSPVSVDAPSPIGLLVFSIGWIFWVRAKDFFGQSQVPEPLP